MVNAIVKITAKVSIPMSPTSEALGADHRVQEVHGHRGAEQQKEDVHGHTRSQKVMKA
jgi:hypothetical protein